MYQTPCLVLGIWPLGSCPYPGGSFGWLEMGTQRQEQFWEAAAPSEEP